MDEVPFPLRVLIWLGMGLPLLVEWLTRRKAQAAAAEQLRADVVPVEHTHTGAIDGDIDGDGARHAHVLGGSEHSHSLAELEAGVDLDDCGWQQRADTGEWVRSA